MAPPRRTRVGIFGLASAASSSKFFSGCLLHTSGHLISRAAVDGCHHIYARLHGLVRNTLLNKKISINAIRQNHQVTDYDEDVDHLNSVAKIYCPVTLAWQTA